MHQLTHSTAVVDATARIGANTTIGPYAVIEADAVIGADCSIGSHAVIKSHTLMGDKNQIFEGAVVGGIPQDLHFVGSKTVLKIGHRNIIREGVTIHRSASTKESTVVGNDNYLMAHAHVAHNCVLEDHIVIANNVLLAGHIHVESHSFYHFGWCCRAPVLLDWRTFNDWREFQGGTGRTAFFSGRRHSHSNKSCEPGRFATGGFFQRSSFKPQASLPHTFKDRSEAH